jgi:hypothetical protein
LAALSFSISGDALAVERFAILASARNYRFGNAHYAGAIFAYGSLFD